MTTDTTTPTTWFTDDRRQAIQAALGTLLPLLAFLGFIDDNQAGAITAVVAALLQLAQGIVALTLLRGSERARWLGTVMRGLVYALAAAAGPLGVAFRWWGDETAGTILTVVGMALTVFAAFLQAVNVQTISAGSADNGRVPVITSLPDPSTVLPSEYRDARSALEQSKE
jgi:hypothetical protein